MVNYRGIRLAWLAFCLAGASIPAWPASARLGALQLEYEPPWERAEAAAETAEDSLILRLEGTEARLEVFLPRQRPRLKIDEARFLEQLEARWTAHYGTAASFDWVEAGARRWRLCRRPSLAGDATVFQLVAVHDGEAYQMVALSPGQRQSLPLSLRELLARASWVPAVAATTPTAVASAVAVPAAGAEPAAAVPDLAPHGGRWRLRRTLVFLPLRPDWAALAEAERGHIAGSAWVSGIGLGREGSGLAWFIEGYAWLPGEGGQEVRQPFSRRWRIGWAPPAPLWIGGEARTLSLSFAGEAAEGPAEGGMTVELRWLAVCAPRKSIIALLDDLERGDVAAAGHLSAMTAACVSENPPPALRLNVSAAERAKSVAHHLVKEVTVPLPAAWEKNLKARTPGVVRLLLEVRFMASTSGDQPGDAMLKPVAAYFVYVPDV